MLNHIVIMGRLTRDPELRRTQSGKDVASFTLAVERDYADQQTGQRGVDFIDVVAWGSSATFVSRYSTKGQMAVVSGRLQLRPWTTNEGQKRIATEVVAEHVYFGQSRQDGGGAQRADDGRSMSGRYGEAGSGAYGGRQDDYPQPQGYAYPQGGGQRVQPAGRPVRAEGPTEDYQILDGPDGDLPFRGGLGRGA